MRPTFIACVGICIALLSVTSRAEEVAGIDTDRPDQTEAPTVVDRGVLQIETGFTYTSDGDGGRSLELPQTLFRIGIIKRLELRIEMDGITKDLAGDDAELGDFGLGAKLKICDEHAWRPETSLIFGTSLPAGDHGVTSGRFDPRVLVTMSNTLSDRISLGYNLGVAWESSEVASRPGLRALFDATPHNDRDTGAAVIYSVSTAFDLTDRLGTFVEIFGDIPLNIDRGPSNYLDAGFTWAPLKNLQFDLSGGVGLSEAAADWFIGAGVSVRFPK